jgi:hypothetical protein
MRKLLLSLAVVAFFMVSCNNEAQPDRDQNSEKSEVVAPKVIDINNFDTEAEGLGDQLVEVTGTVVHTCKHGGTKMFITGNNPDFRLKITATDESGNFNLEMEGSDYTVVGILDEYRVDMAELDKMEADVLAENPQIEDMKHGKANGEGNDHADHEGDDHQEVEGSCEAELAQIADLRAQVEATGKGYLSFYSILAKSYKEAK